MLSRLSKARKDVGEAVLVRFGAHIGHGIQGKCDVKSLFICLTRSSFYAGTSSHASDDDLGYSIRL